MCHPYGNDLNAGRFPDSGPVNLDSADHRGQQIPQQAQTRAYRPAILPRVMQRSGHAASPGLQERPPRIPASVTWAPRLEARTRRRRWRPPTGTRGTRPVARPAPPTPWKAPHRSRSRDHPARPLSGPAAICSRSSAASRTGDVCQTAGVPWKLVAWCAATPDRQRQTPDAIGARWQ